MIAHTPRLGKVVAAGLGGLLLVLVLGLPWAAARVSASPSSPQESPPPLPPHQLPINAKSAVLMDAHTGQVLVAYRETLRLPPASFAKLLTLYLVFDTLRHGKLRLDDEIYVSKKAWRTGGSRMFIEVGSKVPLRELIKGIAVVSGNDACVAVAEHLYGSTELFAQAMNTLAASIGMRHSHFTNPHGLPDENQYTTALDMALLARSYLANFPEALQFHSMQEYTYAGIRQHNRNGLLRKDPSVDGLKTGYIAEAGYHLLATAKRDGWRLIAVVMGAESPSIRETEALKLLNYGYRHFVRLMPLRAGEPLATLPVWKGKRGQVQVVAGHDAPVVVPREDSPQVRKILVLPTEVTAPLRQGQPLGHAEIRLGTALLHTVPLQAAEVVPRAGLPTVLAHHLYLLGRDHTTLLLLLSGSMLPLVALFALLSMRGRRRRRSTRFTL
ncbi:MAG: D-alanyl-D-alanine carboxypeptidase [Candidatus Tectimicrobiota bacterium]|nr:MAG: D-alanyl-D-alanine carboxypeptidase [Candidatus Tectomicrobia bacterium]